METYITVTEDGKWKGPELQAIDHQHAEQQCPDGFRVEGQLWATVTYRDGFDPDQYLRDIADANTEAEDD